MPANPKAAEELRAPLINLITAIIDSFKGFEQRSVQSTLNIQDEPLGTNGKQPHKLIPDITILGSDPNISSRPTKRDGVLSPTYVNCLSPIHITLFANEPEDREHNLAQMARYAKYCDFS